MLRTAIVAIFSAAYVILAGIPLILYSIFAGSADLMYRLTMRAFGIAFRLSGIRVRAEGLEMLPAGVCIFAANHASNLDPPAIAAVLPRRISVLAKHQLFRIPIVSTALRLGKVVPVDRANRESAMASVERAIELLRGGLSFLVFPEGTRSSDGRLGEFRKGIFLMAIRAGMPVVPVSVSGSQFCQGKGEWRIHPGEIVVRFGPAVDARKYQLESKDLLIREVRVRVAAGLAESQRPLTRPAAI